MKKPSKATKNPAAESHITTDIAIVGAGPVGLCLAVSLSSLGLSCVLIEKQDEAKIASPAYDGREIALTQRSTAFLKQIGVWHYMDEAGMGQIDTACVMNEENAEQIIFSHEGGGYEQLAHMVPNAMIRAAAYQRAKACDTVSFICGQVVVACETTSLSASVRLDDGRQVKARMVVAADSRMSPLRQMMGIETLQRKFNRTMIVSRFKHEKPHENVAYEWFQREGTLAILPLAGRSASAVLTVADAEAKRLLTLGDKDYAKFIENMFGRKHGRMTCDGARTAYSLVTIYAKKFFAPSFALMGDAAVGMHPVTAHGFNFGLKAAEILSELIERARSTGADYGARNVLAEYGGRLRVATLPLYAATNFIATLYSRTDPVSRRLRQGLAQLAQRLKPVRDFISRRLMDAS